MLKKLYFVVLVLMLVGTSSVAEAQSGSDEWQFQIAPFYLWAVNIDGTMTIRDRFDQDFGVDFSDAFDNLEGAFTVHFEASKGRWGVLADVSRLNLAGSQDIRTPGGTADIDIENLILEGAGAYEFADTWWVIAGVRYFKLDSDIGFQLDIAPEIAVTESWTDLFAGLLWRPKLGERWTFAGRFDIGAGGSDLVWNAEAIIDFRIGKWAAILAGYRHLDYDYESSDADVKVDMAMSGPVVAFRFFW
ncbi:MAG: hypothetical protein MUP13_06060 [Thermoanaerobaculales bacterium]|nr:hypothetical protein [Thermoanaerobaculales bacterium]